MMDKKERQALMREIKAALNWTDVNISAMFGYKTPASYRSSSKKARIEEALIQLTTAIRKHERTNSRNNVTNGSTEQVAHTV